MIFETTGAGFGAGAGAGVGVTVGVSLPPVSTAGVSVDPLPASLDGVSVWELPLSGVVASTCVPLPFVSAGAVSSVANTVPKERTNIKSIAINVRSIFVDLLFIICPLC